jgi:hypothetical protein
MTHNRRRFDSFIRNQQEDKMKYSEQLEELYKNKKLNGLVDVKFDVDFSTNPDFESLCKEVLDMETAIFLGKVTPLEFGDMSWK